MDREKTKMDIEEALDFLENVNVCHNCECWYENLNYIDGCYRNFSSGCYRNFTDKKRNCDLRDKAVEVLRKQLAWMHLSEVKDD